MTKEIDEHTAACDLSHSSSAERLVVKEDGERSESIGLKYGSNSVLSDFVTLVCDESHRRSQLVSEIATLMDYMSCNENSVCRNDGMF